MNKEDHKIKENKLIYKLMIIHMNRLIITMMMIFINNNNTNRPKWLKDIIKSKSNNLNK